MPLYKKILVAIDVSEESEQVLETAADLAAANNAELSIIHVAQKPVSPYVELYGAAIPYSKTQIRENLFGSLSVWVEAAGLSKSLIQIDFGGAIDIIIDRAKSFDADLILLGSHGRHGIKLLLGSTANGVLHHANCDVLAVRIRELIDQP
jgi:universal stress protein A